MKQPDAESAEPKKAGRGLLDCLLIALTVCVLLALIVMFRPLQNVVAPTIPPEVDNAETNVTDVTEATRTTPDIPDVPADDAPRGHLMSLGLALLFVSLGVCLYATYRLGFCCIWREHNRSRFRRNFSRLHLLSRADLPPPYGAVVDLQPPPYYTIIAIRDDRLSPAIPVAPAPAPSRLEAGAAARPQEAG